MARQRSKESSSMSPHPPLPTLQAGGVAMAPSPTPRPPLATPRDRRGTTMGSHGPGAGEASPVNELLKWLRKQSAGEPAGVLALEKLAAQEGRDGIAVACGQVARWFAERLENQRRRAVRSSGEPGVEGSSSEVSAERQQLAAQVAFLENKAQRLREKLSMRTDGQEPGATDGAEGMLERGEMVAEIEMLRSELMRLGSAGVSTATPPSHPSSTVRRSSSGFDKSGFGPGDAELDALRVRIAEAQAQVATMVSEKEAAESLAELARRLLASMETRLQDVVRCRESEQLELVEEQRKLQRRLELQVTQLAALERTRSHQRQQDNLRATIADSQQELKTLRLEEEEYERKHQEFEEGSADLADEIDEDQLAEQELEEQRLRDAFARAAQEKADVERLVLEKSEELKEIGLFATQRELELRERISTVREDSEAALRCLEEEHERELSELNSNQAEVVRQLTDATEKDIKEILTGVADEAEKTRQRHGEELDALLAESRTRELSLATRIAGVELELANMRVDAEQARREREFQGTVWLCTRRGAYNKEAVLAILSDVLAFPSVARVRLVDADSVIDVPAPAQNVQATPISEDASPAAVSDAIAIGGSLAALPAEAQAAERSNNAAIGSSSPAADKTDAGESNRPDGPPAVPERFLEVVPPSGVPLRQARPFPGRSRHESGMGVAAKSVDSRTPPSPVAEERSAAADVGGGVGAAREGMSAPATTSESENRWIRLELLENAFEDPAASSSTVTNAVALLDAVRHGHAKLEPFAIVSACIARGQWGLASPWPNDTAELVDRRVRQVRGWQLVFTVFLNREPFIVKFVAFDGESGHEFTLHLTLNDVEDLAPGTSSLAPLEIIEALMPTFRIIRREGMLLLAAVQEANALPSYSNRLDASLSDLVELTSAFRRARRRYVPNLPASSVTALALLPSSGEITARDAEGFADDSRWTTLREEVLLLEDRFFILTAVRANTCDGMHNVRVSMQEAGTCKLFCLELTVDGFLGQQRLLTQHCDFEELSLVLMIEEFMTPALVTVRVVFARNDEHILGMAFWKTDWTSVDAAALAQMPPQRRSQLLEFLGIWPAGARIIVEGAGAALALGGGTRASPSAALTCYAHKTVAPEDAVQPKAYFQPGTSWKLLASSGRRMCESLYVVRVYHRRDPYSQFVVTAFQLETCRAWELFLSAEDAASKLPKVVQACNEARLRDATAGQANLLAPALAEGLARGCILVRVSGTLALVPPSEGSGEHDSRVGVRVLFAADPAESAGSEGHGRLEDALIASKPSLDRACLEVAEAGLAAASVGAILSGGRFVDLTSQGAPGHMEEPASNVHTAAARLGQLDVIISVDEINGGHRLSVYHPSTCTLVELRMPTRDCTCPEKSVASLAEIAGQKVLLVLAEFAFPHVVQILVRGDGNHEFRCSLHSEDAFEILPRSQRDYMGVCVNDLLRDGAIGGAGGAVFEESTVGSVIALSHGVVTLVRAPVNLSAGVGEDEHPAMKLCAASLEVNARRFRLNVTRPHSSDVLTLGIADEADVANAHLLHLSTTVGTTIRSEIRDIAGCRLHLIALVDEAPPALRVAVVELEAQLAFQLIVLDLPVDLDVPPLQDLDPGRLSLASALRSLDMKKAQSQATPSSPSRIVPQRVGTSPNLLAPEVPSTPMSSTVAVEENGTRTKPFAVVHRSMKRLRSGQPVIISIVREALCESEVRFRVLIYHPVTSKETTLMLVSPLLDQVLGECGLETALSVNVSDVDRKHKELGAAIMPLIYVHPDGIEIELRAPPKGSANQLLSRPSSPR